MNKRTTAFAVAAALAAGWAIAAEAPKIADERVDILVKEIEQQQRAQQEGQPGAPQPDTAAIRKYALNQLQSVEVLKNAAIAAGLDKKPEIQARLANVQAELYAHAYTEHLSSQITVNDADIRRLYDSLASQVKLQHVKFDNEATANEALDLLRKGMSFPELMRRYPTDNGIQDAWMSVQQMPPEIAETVNGMTRGQIKPVKMPDGNFFIFKLADTRTDPDAPPFSQVKDMLAEQTKQQRVQEEIFKLLREHGVDPTM